MYDSALSYEYLNQQSIEDLIEIEELCIATQDTWTLARIQKIREWRNPSNRSKVKNHKIANPQPKAIILTGKEVEDIETVSPFEGLYTL